MGPLIRDATDRERTDIAAIWRAAFSPKCVKRWRDRYVKIGDLELNRGLWGLAFGWLVGHLLERDHVAVVDIGGEMVGWVCYSDDEVHFVWVIDHARDRGLGKMLREHAGHEKITHLGGRAA